MTLPSHPSTTVVLTTCGTAFVTSSKKSPPTLTRLEVKPPDAPPTVTSACAHPTKPMIAFGTSKGSINVISLSSSPPSSTHIEPGPNLHGVLHITFAKTLHNDCTILSGHIKGIVRQIDYKTQTLIRTFDLLSPKILSSTLYVPGVGLFLGENRGLLAFYDLTTVPTSPESPTKPSGIIRNLHGDSHLTGIAYDGKKRRVYTIGHNSTLSTTSLTPSHSLKLSFNTHIPFATALTHLYLLPTSDLIVGGFQSDTFVLFNLTQSYQLMQVKAGGWRQSHDFRFTFEPSGTSFTSQMSTGNNSTKPSTLQVYNSPEPLHPSSPGALSHTFSTNYHGSTVHGLSLFQCNGRILSVSGSEDCTLKLFCYDELMTTLEKVEELDRFECSVRAICSSVSPPTTSGAENALIVAVGGKLQIRAYRVSKTSVTLVHSNTDSGKEMDHRMNAVCSVHAKGEAHLVVTGDSRGRMQVTQIDLANSPKSPVLLSQHIEGMSSRPTLSLSVACVSTCRSKFILIAGNTAGEVGIFHLTHDKLSSSLSPVLLRTYKPHQIGANAVACEFTSGILTVVSGGDDQALSVNQFSLDDEEDELTPLSSHTLANASTSAIKSTMIDASGDSITIYTIGYDQRLASWDFTTEPTASITQKFQPAVVTVTDVSGADIVPSLRSPDVNFVAVVGDGVEILSVPSSREPQLEIDSRAVNSAAKLLLSATYVLVTTGAGIGKDSGLKTFEEMSSDYRELCDPSALCTSPDKFYEFWEAFAQQYEDAPLHDGYMVLQRLVGEGEGKLPKLESSYCYTSNVDGMMRRLPGFNDGEKVCEIHGFAGEWRCGGAMGKTLGGDKRMGQMWAEWNERAERCGSSPFLCGLAKEEVGDKICSCCGLANRPNVLMFNDTDSNVLSDIDKARENYQRWEQTMEDNVVGAGDGAKSLVILELGCGVNVPSVRNEGYEVIKDLRSRGGRAHLIRVNLKDEGHIEGRDLDMDEDMRRKALVSIKGGAKDTMVLIEAAIERMLEDGEEGEEEEERDLVFDDSWFENKEEEVLQEFGAYGVDEDGHEDGQAGDDVRKQLEEVRVKSLMSTDITMVATPKGIAKKEAKVLEGSDEVEDVEEEEGSENEGRQLEFDDGWDQAKEEEEEDKTERVLEVDDDWGENEEDILEKSQSFGTFKDDEDVKEKHLREEDEKERREEEERLQEEALKREKEEKAKEEEAEKRELFFEDF